MVKLLTPLESAKANFPPAGQGKQEEASVASNGRRARDGTPSLTEREDGSVRDLGRVSLAGSVGGGGNGSSSRILKEGEVRTKRVSRGEWKVELTGKTSRTSKNSAEKRIRSHVQICRCREGM